MKRRLAALLLALLLPLAGCASMLDRSYQSVTPHIEYPPAEPETELPQAETYQGLVNVILYYVTLGAERGMLRLTNYTRDVEADLLAACTEVSQDDPLGAYAVEKIDHSWSRIVSYYEVELTISYRRTREQTARIITASGAAAIRAELRRALSNFSSEVVLRSSAFTGDELFIEQLLREAYDSAPAAALGMPGYEIVLYPDGGAQRIIEVVLTYESPASLLRNRSAALTAASVDLAARLPEGTLLERLAAIHELLHARATYQTGDRGTAYDLLMGGETDSEGFALAAALLYSTAGLSGNIVRGTLDGVPHVWNTVPDETETRVIDFSLPEFQPLTEEEAAELAYTPYS